MSEKNIEKVLGDHLKSHIKVAKEQLTEKDKMTIFREFDDAIVNQLKKLGAKAKDGERKKNSRDAESRVEKKESICEKSPDGKHQFQGGHGLYYCRFCDEKWSRQLHSSKKEDYRRKPIESLEKKEKTKEPPEAGSARQTEEKPPKIIEAKPQKVWYNKKQVKPPEPKYIPKFTDITSDVVGNDMDTEEAFNYGKDLEKDYKIVEKADLTQINADLWWACGTILEVLKDKTYRDGTKHQAKQMRERWDKKIKKLLGGDENNK